MEWVVGTLRCDVVYMVVSGLFRNGKVNPEAGDPERFSLRKLGLIADGRFAELRWHKSGHVLM